MSTGGNVSGGRLCRHTGTVLEPSHGTGDGYDGAIKHVTPPTVVHDAGLTVPQENSHSSGRKLLCVYLHKPECD